SSNISIRSCRDNEAEEFPGTAAMVDADCLEAPQEINRVQISNRKRIRFSCFVRVRNIIDLISKQPKTDSYSVASELLITAIIQKRRTVELTEPRRYRAA